MEIDERTVAGVTILRPEGKLDAGDAEACLKTKLGDLMHRSRPYVLLDLRDVVHIDSLCIGLMVGAYVSLRNRGGGLKLLMPRPRFREQLHITKLDTVFETFDSEDEAIKSFTVTASS